MDLLHTCLKFYFNNKETFLLGCSKNSHTRRHGGVFHLKCNKRVESGRKATSLLIVRLIIAIVFLNEQLQLSI